MGIEGAVLLHCVCMEKVMTVRRLTIKTSMIQRNSNLPQTHEFEIVLRFFHSQLRFHPWHGHRMPPENRVCVDVSRVRMIRPQHVQGVEGVALRMRRAARNDILNVLRVAEDHDGANQAPRWWRR